jgi:hypothetical protein
MKKIILTLMLMISSISIAQDSQNNDMVGHQDQPVSIMYNNYNTQSDINLNLSNGGNILDNNKYVPVGPLMMLGGASFIAAGLLTTPVYVGGSTTEKKPFFQQGGRAAAIISGCVVIVGGVIISF